MTTFATALVSPFVGWLVYAAVFHAISVVFDGDGPFPTTLALVGWGMVPSVIGSVAQLAINYYRFSVRGLEAPPLDDPEAVQEFVRSPSSGPLVALGAGLGVLVTLWSAVLWTHALRYAWALSLRDAALTVALPALVGVALSVSTLVGAL